MKRVVLVRHICKHGCALVREGANHSIFVQPELQRTSAIPRHNDIDDFLAKKICKDLGIPLPSRR